MTLAYINQVDKKLPVQGVSLSQSSPIWLYWLTHHCAVCPQHWDSESHAAILGFLHSCWGPDSGAHDHTGKALTHWAPPQSIGSCHVFKQGFTVQPLWGWHYRSVQPCSDLVAFFLGWGSLFFIPLPLSFLPLSHLRIISQGDNLSQVRIICKLANWSPLTLPLRLFLLPPFYCLVLRTLQTYT